MSRAHRGRHCSAAARRRGGSAIALGTIALLALLGAPTQAAAPTSPAQLYAFGDNERGQLGNATNDYSEEPNPVPTPVTLPGALGPVTRVAAGGEHSLAVTSSGQLYAFGGNRYSQLGNRIHEKTEEPNPTPTLVRLPGALGPVTQVAAGAEHSLAVTSAGQLYAFGHNEFGQLGNRINDGAYDWNNDPTPTLVRLPGAGGPVIQVAAGEHDSFAVTSTGQLYAFGENQVGQLGIASDSGTKEANPTPRLVTLPGADGPVTEVAAGWFHTLAVTSTGQLFAFGSNVFGQLGNATHDRALTPNPTPRLVRLPGADGGVIEVAAGYDDSLAVTSTGQLYAFGSNVYGELGSTTNNGTSEPNPTPRLVRLPGAGGPVTQVAAGYSDSLVITATGQLYAFGLNTTGELGDTTNEGTLNPNPTPALVSLPAGTTVGTVARGSEAFHTLAVGSEVAVTSGALPGGALGVPYSSTVHAAGGTKPYAWSAAGLPAGLSINPASGQITGTPTTPGAANITLTVTDGSGIAAVSAVIPFTIAPPLPVLSAVSLTHDRFAVSRTPTAIAANKAPVGTTFRFTLSQPATLQLEVTPISPALAKGHRCPTHTAGREPALATRCAPTLTSGALTRTNEPVGGDLLAFSGRIGPDALAPGAYTAALTAWNAAGSSRPVKLAFTIVE